MSIDPLEVTLSEEDQRHLEEVWAWLDENTASIPEPNSVTLFDFSVNWVEWSGSFQIRFDDILYTDRFRFSEDGTGKVRVNLPMFVSPLGAPASYPAIEISDRTRQAIQRALDATLPKITPHGRNRETGIETTISTPIHQRLNASDLCNVKELISSNYEISMSTREDTSSE